MSDLSIRESLRGQNLLITGASGFIGKVYLAMLLERVPETGLLYLLLRSGKRTATQRLAHMFDTSPVFLAVWSRCSPEVAQRMRNRVQAIAGDVCLPNLGIADDQLDALRTNLDLVVNLAGLVDFDPDIREAYAANIQGPIQVANFTASCKNSRLLHVSTAYVSGTKGGRIPELIETETPNGQHFNPHTELQSLQDEIAREVDQSSAPHNLNEIRREICAREHDCGACPRHRCMAPSLAASRLRASMAALGSHRARELGWTNTYTYSKALSERLLSTRTDLQLCIFRPAIVESANRYPFTGWNEGFNTSGPIIQLLGTWLRRVRVGTHKAIDLIPVDYVAKGLVIASASLIRGRHAPVYHCGSSDHNPITVERCVELSALAHRQYWKQHGPSWLERRVLSRWDARPVTSEPWMGISLWKWLSSSISTMSRKVALPLPHAQWRPLHSFGRRCGIWARKLARLEMVLKTYEPFLCESAAVFECKGLRRHHVIEPEFSFAPEDIDWFDYMLHCHIPGIRKWCLQDSKTRDPIHVQPTA